MTSNKLVTLALIVSVGANLLLAGVLIGRHLHEWPDRAPFDWAMKTLPEETREKLKSRMREHRRESEPLVRNLREAQHVLRDAITTEPYDEQQVAAAFAEIRAASAALQASMHEHMRETLADLAPEERKHMFRLMMRAGGPRDGGPPPRP